MIKKDARLTRFLPFTRFHTRTHCHRALMPPGGDKILEWDGKSLVNCSYEQVCTIIDCSGKTAELIIEPLNRE